MSPAKRPFTFALTDDLKRLLQEVRRREGVSEAEQIRRGLRLWFEARGYRFDDDGGLDLEQRRALPKARAEKTAPKKRRVKKTNG